MTDQDNANLLALYHRSRDEQPSDILDQRIRRAAQRAISFRQRSRLWKLSRVAVVVLSFSIIMQLWYDYSVKKDGADLAGKRDYSPSPNVTEQREPALMEEMKAEHSIESNEELTAAEKRSISPATREATSTTQSLDLFITQSAEPSTPMPAGQAMVPENQLVLPLFPLDADLLVDRASRLTVLENPSGHFLVYNADQLILQIEKKENSALIRAWRGAELLGVSANWNMTIDNDIDCTHHDEYRKCGIDENVNGYFDKERLVYIEWVQ